jgi:acyl-coenzyme A synthetase/AMP-(fatty) acid ligase
VTFQDLLSSLEAAGPTLLDADSPPLAYGRCAAEAQARAERWRREGVGRGSVVIIEGLAGLPLLRAILTAWLAGAVPFPRESDGGEQFAGATFRLKGGEPEMVRGGGPDARLANAAILHRTSGSAGRCRLARRSAATLVAEARRYGKALSLSADDRVLVVLPIHHSFGWGFLLGGLLAGCRVDLRSGFSPARVAEEIDRGRVSVVGLTPPMAALLAARPGTKPETPPRWAVAGAGPVDEKLERAFERRFGVGLARNYGSTETGATFSGPPGLADGVVGDPMAGVKVLAPAAGREGELVLELSPPVDGYLDGEPAARWTTGDLVERDAGGRVRVTGRLDAKLRVNGQTLDRARIEAALIAYPGLEEVHLLARPRRSKPGVEDLVAVVRGSEISREELIRHCVDRLPSSHCPSEIVLCDTLPRTTLGKLNLKEIFRRVDSGAQAQASRGGGQTSGLRPGEG